jgi:hypothetical protein
MEARTPVYVSGCPGFPARLLIPCLWVRGTCTWTWSVDTQPCLQGRGENERLPHPLAMRCLSPPAPRNLWKGCGTSGWAVLRLADAQCWMTKNPTGSRRMAWAVLGRSHATGAESCRWPVHCGQRHQACLRGYVLPAKKAANPALSSPRRAPVQQPRPAPLSLQRPTSMFGAGSSLKESIMLDRATTNSESTLSRVRFMMDDDGK